MVLILYFYHIHYHSSSPSIDIQTSTGEALKEFKETKAEEDVVKALRLFLHENPAVKVTLQVY